MRARDDKLNRPRSWMAPLALLAVLTTLVLAGGLGLTEGQLTYALDDSYVHMAMAKNLAQHGVWGVTRHEFSSSSSSPLWTLLLAGVFTATGPVDAVPLVLNLICAVAVVFVAHRLLTARAAPGYGGAITAALLALVACVPLAGLIATGQEHTLHLLLVLLFAGMVAERLSRDGEDLGDGKRKGAGEHSGGAELRGGGDRPARCAPWVDGRLWLVAAALALVRYESLFLVLGACVLLSRRGRRGAALALGAAAALPVVAFGAISLSHGWLFFPNSLVLKANLPGESAGQTLRTLTGYVVLRRLIANAHLLVLVAAALACLAALARGASEVQRGRAGSALLVLFLVTLVLHLALADVGWFYRYEAYLVGLGLVAAAAGWLELRARSTGQPAPRVRLRGARAWALALLVLLATGVLADRGARAMLEAPRAMRNIHEQQVQMGRFLREHYAGAAVAVNDIGAVNYLADVRCLDLMGLASRDVAAQLRAGTYGTRALDELIRRHGVKVAIVYDNWIRIPETWQRVGRWRIQDNVVTGGDTVSFYAIDPAEAPRLSEALRRFAPRLPKTVQQAGPYLEG